MNKVIAVNQPYFLANLGYYQLISAVDTFIFYDDVNFINKGWINRNRILAKDLEDKAYTFTIPLSNASQNKLIKDTLIQENYSYWKTKFFKTLLYNYSKAPYFEEGYALIQGVLNSVESNESINILCQNSILNIMSYLGFDILFKSSTIYNNQHLKSQERILDICKQEQATDYINLSGGKALYNKHDFEKNNIKLLFHQIQPYQYKQFNYSFVPNLSIIDALMFCSKKELQILLQQYKLEEN